MNRLLKTLCIAAALLAGVAVTSTHARAGIEQPPPWAGWGQSGGTTHWCFDFFPPNPTGGGPLDPRPGGFGPGHPQINLGNSIWQPSSPFGGDGVICIPAGGGLEILVPNYNDPAHTKLIWVQYHFFGGAEPVVDVFVPGAAGASPWGPTVTPSPGPGGGLIGAQGLQLPFCPPFEIIRITNPGPQPIYLEWLCIDTICIPAPGSAAVLALAGMAAMRRRR